MTRYVIIEDERYACDELQRMVANLRADYVLAGWAQSVTEAVKLLSEKECELIFTDIQLGDGLGFDIFEHAPTNTPVIFTTAYDEYALRAFKLNSIDYLLKPISEEELTVALDKFERSRLCTSLSTHIRELARSYTAQPKTRFLIRVGDTFRSVFTADIATFHSEDKATYLHTFGGKSYLLDFSLDQIETSLPAEQFFRL